MLASTDEPPAARKGLVYEPKYDGIRALVDLDPAGRAVLYSRNGHDKTAQFPAIVSALSVIAKKVKTQMLLDGEIVAIDAAGKPLGFERLQGRIHLTGNVDVAKTEKQQPAAIVLFDILRDGDEDLRGQPWAARRMALHTRLAKMTSPTVRLSEVVLDDGTAMLERAGREGWEGLIVKDAQSLYHSGRRTPAWRKLKLLKQQEFVIGGWTEPRQSRSHFGSILVGYYEGRKLIFAGSVGTGFTQRELTKLGALFAKRTISASPFANRVASNEVPHYIRPDLVCQVKFIEMTSEGLLRQPVYLGLRDDKAAREVLNEKVSSKVSSSSKVDSSGVVEQLADLEKSKKDGEILLPNGDRLRVTNLRKVLWPEGGVTKGELLRYYAAVAPLILPVVDDRPLVMKRSPNGVEKPFFYQQRHPEVSPPGVRREELPKAVDPMDDVDGSRERLIGGSITTLLYMTQLAAISQDPWFSRVSDPMSMDFAAIDLDPGEGATFRKIVDVARWVKDELDRLGIPAVPKTSGSAGLHIYIPLPKKTSYETGQLLCHVVATLVSTRHPKVATIERMVKKRASGTVYVDYLQNILGKTLACAYSARASGYAGVSTPLAWDEITDKLNPRDFTVRTAMARFDEVGDLWKPLRTMKPVNIERVLNKMK
jgi:bifunctional non-homologous end joining protein LigD